MSLILAADLGKFNSVLCWFEPDSRRTEFRTVRSSAAELRTELLRQPVSQVVFEACSQAGWVVWIPAAGAEAKNPVTANSRVNPVFSWRRRPVPEVRSPRV